MSIHLQREITKLKKTILSLGALVEDRVRLAVKSVNELDEELAAKIVRDDTEIDEMEVQAEEDCLKILALHQPVAVDLRFIVAVLKINNDLERIGDLAVNIAEGVPSMAKRGKSGPDVMKYFTDMTQRVQAMLKNSLDALINMDVELARRVCASDDYVDDLNRKLYDYIREKVDKKEEDFGHGTQMVRIFRQFERIADMATNIAEDVIYMCRGEIVRHRTQSW